MQLKPTVLLAGIVAIAASAGLVVSLTQRPVLPLQPIPTPFVVPTPFTFPTPPADPTPLPRQPSGGFGFSVVDDPVTQTVVVFGGVDDYDNTWLWNDNHWTLARPRSSPPGRFNASAAYDPLTRQVLLFGGRLEAGQLVNDTWAWDGRTWHEVNSGKGGPPSGEFSAMAWDNASSTMVLASAPESGAAQSRETWIWGGNRWVHQIGGAVPLGTTFNMAFDPLTQSLLATSCCGPVAGGAGAGTTTWMWSGTAWLHEPTHTSPPSDYGPTLDPLSGRLIVEGINTGASPPQLWSWNGRDWTLLAYVKQPPYPDALVTDVNRNQLLMFGSDQPASQSTPQTLAVWALQDNGWHQLASR